MKTNKRTIKINKNDAIQIKYIWDGDYFKFYIGKNLILIIPYEKFKELKIKMQRF